MIREELLEFFAGSDYTPYNKLSQKEENKIKKIDKNINLQKVIAFKDLSTLFNANGYVFTEDYIYAGKLQIAIKDLELFERVSENKYKYSYGGKVLTVELNNDIGDKVASFIKHINELETNGIEYFNNKDYKSAVKCLKVPAYYKRFQAINYLSLCYEFGVGVKKDINKAIEMYKSIFPYDVDEYKTAEKLIEVGDINYNQGNYLRSYVAYKAADDKGDKIAPYYIGYLYHYGKGFEQNYDEAVKWYKKALDRNPHHQKTHYHLALILKSQRNYIEMSSHRYECSREDECYLEGLLYYEGDYFIQHNAQARKLFEIASSKKTNAFYHIAVIAKEQSDYKAHFENLVKGYNANDKRTINPLGEAYEKGLGCDVDLKKAFELYQEGSKYYFECSANLARCYGEGIYVAKDLDKALKHLNECIADGYTTAYADMAKIYINNGDCDKAIEVLNKKEAKQNAVCAVLLADCYINGVGVSRDQRVAYNLLSQWLRKENDTTVKLALMKHVINNTLALTFNELTDIMEAVSKLKVPGSEYTKTFRSFKDVYKQKVVDKYITGRKFEGTIERLLDSYSDCVYFYKGRDSYYFIDVESLKVLEADFLAVRELEKELNYTNRKLEVGYYAKYRTTYAKICHLNAMPDWN